MKKEDKEVKKKLIQARESVRRKSRLLKQGRAALQSIREESAQPLIGPLKDLTSSLLDRTMSSTLGDPSTTMSHTTTMDVGTKSKSYRKRKPDIPTSEMEVQSDADPATTIAETQAYDPLARQYVFDEGDSFSFDPDVESTQIQQQTFSKPSKPQRKRYSSEGGSPLLKKALSTPEGKRIVKEGLEAIPTHVRPYFKWLMTGDMGAFEMDREYGPRVQPHGKVTLGSSDFSITPHSIIVGGQEYAGTRGLYHLIFLHDPSKGAYDQSDLDAYKDIIERSNLARVGFSKDQPYNTSGKKYKTFIKKLLDGKATGSGVFNIVSDRPIQYVAWNDPNELVDRLRLLVASSEAGNNSHRNEINAIIEELMEEGYISI